MNVTYFDVVIEHIHKNFNGFNIIKANNDAIFIISNSIEISVELEHLLSKLSIKEDGVIVGSGMSRSEYDSLNQILRGSTKAFSDGIKTIRVILDDTYVNICRRSPECCRIDLMEYDSLSKLDKALDEWLMGDL